MSSPKYNLYASKLIRKYFKKYGIKQIESIIYEPKDDTYCVKWAFHEYNLVKVHKEDGNWLNHYCGFIAVFGYLTIKIKTI